MRKLLNALYYLALFSFGSGMLIYLVTISYFSEDVPIVPSDLNEIVLTPPTYFFDRNGDVFSSFGGRLLVPLDSISTHFKSAILAKEDKTFYSHKGINKIAIIRSFLYNFILKKRAYGGSTITQQLAKNLFFTFEKTFTRKIKEMLVTFQIEENFSKDDILEAYANLIFYGNNSYGIERASQNYFNKKSKDLKLSEASLLAGIINAPSRYNPLRHYERAKIKQKQVLDRMVRAGFITESEADIAYADSLEFNTKQTVKDGGAYFRDYVVAQLKDVVQEDVIYYGGLKIYTTYDPKLQRIVRDNINAHLNELDEKMGYAKKPFSELKFNDPSLKNYLQGAATLIDNSSGAIRAIVGGRSHKITHFNRALNDMRQVGSNFKPFIYFAAIDSLGFNENTVIMDSIFTKKIGRTIWKPENFGNKYFGNIIIKSALQKSLNSVAARLIDTLTPQGAINYAKKFGISKKLPPYYSVALGSIGISTIEMAKAYSIFANCGTLREPYAITLVEDYRGKVVAELFPKEERIFSKTNTFILRDMLASVINKGTGYNIRTLGFRGYAGGKTGTTNDYRDVWFSGFTENYTLSTWVGYDDNRRMVGKIVNGRRKIRRLTGANGAAPIWGNIMKEIDNNSVNIFISDEVITDTVDINTGEKYFDSNNREIVIIKKDLR
jgi:1A family penicillin-binding protein